MSAGDGVSNSSGGDVSSRRIVSSGLEQRHPPLKRPWESVLLAKQPPGSRAHVYQDFRLRLEASQHVRQRIGVTYRYLLAAACAFNNAAHFAVLIADKNHGSTGGQDAIELARDDESLERWQQTHEMHVRGRQAILQGVPRLVR